MEVLELNNKRYIKASSAARETGYTMDYIGQLCRKKKIDAQLVGRTWYVLEDQLFDHRRTRGRSTSAKLKESVKEEISRQKETVVAPAAYQPEYRKRLLDHNIKYHTDTEELLPQVSQEHKVTLEAVHIAIATEDTTEKITPTIEQKLKIKTSDEEQVVGFAKTEPREIKWNGTIVVSPLESIADEPDIEREISVQEGHSSEKAEVQIHPALDERASRKIPIHRGISDRMLPGRERFLVKLNQAHALNEENAPEVAKLVTAVTPDGIESPILGKLPFILAGATFVCFIAASIFLQNIIRYDSGNGEVGSQALLHSGYGISSMGNVTSGFQNAVSSIRDMTSNKI